MIFYYLCKMAAYIQINGKTYRGDNLSIINGKFVIDNEDVTPNEKEIRIEVNGNIGTLNVDVCEDLQITGDVDKVRTLSGDITITGNARSKVETQSGDIVCGDVYGNVKTMSGDVKSGHISGDVNTMSGDIKHKKASKDEFKEWVKKYTSSGDDIVDNKL